MLRSVSETVGITLNSMTEHVSSDIENADKSTQKSNSLPIISGEYETGLTLMDSLIKRLQFVTFLYWSAGYYPETITRTMDWWYRFQFGFVRLVLVVMAVFAIFVSVDSGVEGNSTGAFFWVATTLGYASVVPGQYLNQRRLQGPAKLLDASVLDPSMRVVYAFAIVSALSVTFGLIVFGIALNALIAPGYVAFNMLTMITEFFAIMYLSFNLLFLLIDLHVSSLLLDQLHLLVDNRTLTMETFIMVRGDIQRRCRESQWATDIVILPCAASAIGILAILYNLEQGRYGKTSSNMQSSIALILILLKELWYLAIAFWYVAKVNAKADTLTVKLSQAIWSTKDGYGPDIERLSMYASSLAEPITFSLVFKRLGWNDILVSGTGFAVTALVGVVKLCLGINSA